MKYILIAIALLMVRCKSGIERARERNPLVEYSMSCEEVNDWTDTYRCENAEVICYMKMTRDSGIDCKFK